GVGYAFLQQDLVINGTANIGDAKWDVKITNIQSTSLVGATLVEKEGVTNPSFTDTSATFNVDLEYPGASAEFAVTVTNAGSIDAILNSITGVDIANEALPVEIQFEVTGVTEKVTTLDAGATNTVNVKVTWVSNGEGTEDTIPETPSKTATITLNYIQNTGTTNTEGN
ncbi:MAG: hypothetical protein IJO27_03225, partial [Bacilli bacterium]|nr:hypothetical protein [Bacilli bacterium]